MLGKVDGIEVDRELRRPDHRRGGRRELDRRRAPRERRARALRGLTADAHPLD